MQEDKIIESVIYNLLKNEPFYANFLLASKFVFNNPEVERAACGFHQNNITFYFNLEYFKTLTLPQRIAVCKHEVLHVIFDHLGNRMYGMNNRQAKNYAMDCAINQFIPNLPGNCVTLESMSKLCNENLSAKEAWEYYYHKLKDFVEKKSNEKHDHDQMSPNEGDGEMSEGQESIRRAVVKDIVNKSTKSAAGNIPEEITKVLAELNKAGKVNWKQQLRNIVSSSRVVQTKPSRLKVHRRFELDQPGRKKDKKLTLGVCVDSSGSVSDESFQSFMTEIYHIAKMTSVAYLIHADCEVQKVEVIKGGKAKNGVLTSRHGNGGTAYQPAITECKKRQCDVIIYFGDMDAADIPSNPGVPFVWVRVGKQNPPAKFGKIVDLD